MGASAAHARSGGEELRTPAGPSDAVGVLIVEDHRMVASGLAYLLERHADLKVVGRAADGAEAERLLVEHEPAVVLMDHHLPGASGAEVARRLRELRPDVAIVMMSADTNDDAMLSALEAGARGFVSKSEAETAIVDAVRRAARGEPVLPAETLHRLFTARQKREEARTNADLTEREREVLALMAEGLDTRAISDRLGLRINTVRGHAQSVLEKLECHSRLEAVVRARSHGLIPN